MSPDSEDSARASSRLSQLLLAWKPAAAAQAQQPLQRLMGKLSRLRGTCARFWRVLHLAQRCYLLAVLALVSALIGVIPASVAFLLATVASVTAFTIDAWPQLEKFWHSLYGKALMIFVYAIFLNVVLAYAEAAVNHLTGVKPDAMRYTVNLVALMLAPAWFIGGSAFLMLMYMMLHLLKISLFLLVRPFSVRSKDFFEGEAYPLTSLLLRILLLPLTCIMLILMTEAYVDGRTYVKLDETYIGFDRDPVTVQKPTDFYWHWIDANGPVPEGTKNSAYHWYERLAADFLYQVESLGKSSCVLQGTEHGVHIGEFDLLVIKPDPAQASGYHFSVRPCNSPGQQQWFTAGKGGPAAQLR